MVSAALPSGMPHEYTIDVDDNRMLKFSKQHKNGERTEVKADKIREAAADGDGWLANVKDPNGNVRLGKFGTKKEAKRAMKQWMQDNPKGVPGQGSGIAGSSSGIPGTNGNGLF